MALDKFLRYLQFEKRYSAHTLAAYKNDLLQFEAFLSGSFDISDPLEAKHLQIRSWIVSLMNDGVTSRSVNRKISSLKSFYKFHFKRAAIKDNPMVKVQAPKTSKPLPSFVEEDNIGKLFGQVEYDEGMAGTRDRLVMELLYSTGMRLSELVGLKDQDIDLNQLQIKVLGKGNKERILPLDGALAPLIKMYLVERGASNTFFVTDKLQPIYPKMVQRIVKRYLEMVTTLDKKSPHILRHSFATHLINRGADINAIKELLGHASLAATQVYTHSSIEQLKEIYKNSHPKA